MISVEGLAKSYDGFRAVDDVSFEIGTGEVVAFLGPNGAGKTTTLRVLASFLPPTSGRIRVGGVDVVQDPLAARRLVGYLPENNPLYEEMEVTEYLDWSAECRGFKGAERADRVRRALEACGLQAVLGTEIGLLSKGYRQRVGLAQAILHDPPILLLDEPTSGLDPNQAREVRQLLAELKARKTVFLSTHILPEAESLADRVVIIHRGKIAAQGRPGELAAASRTTLLTLKLAPREADHARDSIAALAAVEKVSFHQADGEYRFEVAGSAEADLREPLFRLAVEKGWTLLELKRQGNLEDVFHALTLS